MPYNNSKQKRNENSQNDDDKAPNIWDVLEERKKKGLWDGEIEVIPIKEHKLVGGEHYYIVSDIRKREITCTSCAIRHGGILEARYLTRYKIEDGILYFDGKAQNSTPKKGVDNKN